MTRSEFLKLPTSKAMWTAIVENSELRKDAEVIQIFNDKRASEFKENVIEAFGEFDPAMHYDWNAKK